MRDGYSKAGKRHEPAAQAHGACAEHNEKESNAGSWCWTQAVEWHVLLVLLLIVIHAALPVPARAQAALPYTGVSPSTVTGAPPAQPGQLYTPPRQTTKFRDYLFDAFGPYAVVGAAFTAGLGQANNAPPEWKQGAEGYGRRFGSAFGIAVVSNTARYALAEALNEDTFYYPCGCKGVFPRLKHALISTFTARRGEDGHVVLSVPELVGPYAGTLTAVYAWYPSRYDAKDALRMGSFNLLGDVGGNIALEFIKGSHSFLARLHLNNQRQAPNTGSNP